LTSRMGITRDPAAPRCAAGYADRGGFQEERFAFLMWCAPVTAIARG
jgi:hypothetical protein